MKILIVGGGPTSGASLMRAEQLGHAIGAHVHVDPWHDPHHSEVDRADVIIVVKRLKKRWKRWLAHIHTTRKPIIWDAVDFWQQPEENVVDRAMAIRSFHKRKGELGAHFVIAATKQMARDCGGVYLPHHHRIGLTASPVRPHVAVVAYEGNPTYLDAWAPLLDAECTRRGWRFVVNPTHLADADIVVALRGGVWDGWACRQWKSGVKYANSLAAGRPIITQPAAAFDEMRPPGTVIGSPRELPVALDQWTEYAPRCWAATEAAALVPHYRLESIAATYLAVLREYMGHDTRRTAVG